MYFRDIEPARCPLGIFNLGIYLKHSCKKIFCFIRSNFHKLLYNTQTFSQVTGK